MSLYAAAKRDATKPTYEPPEPQEYSAASYGRVGNRPLESITFVADGVERDFAYSHLYCGVMDGQASYVLTFSGHTVAIRGRGLAKLADAIRRRRVAEVRAVHEAESRQLADSECVVDSISVDELKEEERG